MSEASAENLRWIKYTLLQSAIIPSLICDLFVFYYFIHRWRQSILKTPHNHVIFCLLVTSFLQKTTDLPAQLYYHHWNEVMSHTSSFCLFWTMSNYTLTTVTLILVSWCCLERHFFIFYSHMMRNTWALVLLHYIPLFLCIVYPTIFYLIMIFFPTQCSNTWDYSIIYCAGACYVYVPVLITFDWLFHYAFPILIMIVANTTLFSRLIWRKVRQQQPIDWRRQRRLILQLTFVSGLFLFVAGPAIIVGVVQALWIPTFIMDIQNNYLFYLAIYVAILYPFVIVTSLPEVKKEFKQGLKYLRRSFSNRLSIHPLHESTTQQNNIRTNHGTQHRSGNSN